MVKMVAVERMYHQLKNAGEAIARFRQVFITQSPVLAEKVEDYYEKTLAFLSAEGSIHAEEGTEEGANHDFGLYDRDDEDETRKDLPKAFSELKDEHFPLFITFHHVRHHTYLACCYL